MHDRGGESTDVISPPRSKRAPAWRKRNTGAGAFYTRASSKS